MNKKPFSTADKPRVTAGESWPAQDVPLQPELTLQAQVWRLERRCRTLEARNGDILDRLRAMCNDPATPEGMKQALGDVING